MHNKGKSSCMLILGSRHLCGPGTNLTSMITLTRDTDILGNCMQEGPNGRGKGKDRLQIILAQIVLAWHKASSRRITTHSRHTAKAKEEDTYALPRVQAALFGLKFRGAALRTKGQHKTALSWRSLTAREGQGRVEAKKFWREQHLRLQIAAGRVRRAAHPNFRVGLCSSASLTFLRFCCLHSTQASLST